MDDQSFKEKYLTSWLSLALMRIGTRMATCFDQYFESFGVTQSQFRILLAIRQQGGAQGLMPSALAEYLLIERGTVSVLTNRMVENGWLKREQGENRRTYQLVLTEAGAQMLDELRPRARALADHTLSELPLEQLQQLREDLERIEDRIRNMELPEP